MYHFVFLGSFNGGWISQYADANQFFQIDLGSVTKVTRIATQGRDDAGWWTKTYSIDYSVDEGTFQPYGEVDAYIQTTIHFRMAAFLLVLTHYAVKAIKANTVLPKRCMVARSVCFPRCSISAL